MFNWIQVVELLNSSNFASFMVSLGAGITWDAIKLIFSKSKMENSIEHLALEMFEEVFEEFYTFKGMEFDRDCVMTRFMSQISEQDITSAEIMKRVISVTVDYEMDSIDYSSWLRLFSTICSKATPHNSGKQSNNHRWQQKVQRI